MINWEKENDKGFLPLLGIPPILIGIFLLFVIGLIILLFVGVALTWKVILALLFGIGGFVILIRKDMPLGGNLRVIVAIIMFVLAMICLFVLEG